jgi:hypothetical protein
MDPIGLAGGLNLYGFAGGDPINFSDPFGLCAQDTDGRWSGCSLRTWWAGFRRGFSDALAFERSEPGEHGYVTGQKAAVAGMLLGARAGGAPGARVATASGASGRILLGEGDAALAVVHNGRIVAQTADVTLSHAGFVQRTLGALPDGARVVTVGRHQGQINVLNSRTFHGNQLPAPQDVWDVVRAGFQ